MVTKAAPPRVSPLCPGGTVVCLGSGPSLTVADVEYVRDKADAVIAVNDAVRLAPWADVLYACDAKWWFWHEKDEWLTTFRGLRYALDPVAKRYPGVVVLRNTGDRGLELDPTGLRAGRNSGYQAINLAVHLGARRVILLGYDMHGGGGGHWFGSHPDGSRPPYAICLQRFATLVEPLAAAGVEVINCTPKSALTVFPRAPLREVLVAPPVEVAS
jgi:hypothetical protein